MRGNFFVLLMRLAVVVVVLLVRPSCLEQVKIYDTTELESLDWLTNEKSDYRSGWRESSYNMPSGSLQRVIAVCNVDLANVQNWISTPLISIPFKVNRIYVNIVFTVRKCERFPDPASLQQCKEVFRLAYYESNSTENDVRWDSFQTVDTIAATNLFTSSKVVITNNETKSIGMGSSTSTELSRRLRLAFYDEGSCTTILSFRVYHLVCPQVVANFVSFPETTVGPDLTSVVEAAGACVENSVRSGSSENLGAIRRICQADGRWYRMESTGCECKPGFQPNASASYDSCIECPPGSYKSSQGNDNCLYCPLNSISTLPASRVCLCKPGFMRYDSSSYDQPCYKIIGPIRNLTVTNVTESSVSLSWLPPQDLPSSSLPPSSSSSSLPSSLVYYVDCPSCEELPFVRYLPRKSGQMTGVSIGGLLSSTYYTVSVRLRNETTKMDLNSSSASTTFLTLSSPATGPSDGSSSPSSQTMKAYLLGIFDGSVDLAWDSGSLSLRSFEIVVCYEVDREYKRISVVDSRNVTIDHLEQGQTYSFRVRGEVSGGWTAFSNPVYAKIGDPTPIDPTNLPRGGSNASVVGAAVGGVIGGIALLLGLGLIIFIFFFRKTKSKDECNKSASDCDILKYVNATIKTTPQIQSNTPSDSTMRSGESFHIYADPTSFDQETTITSLNSLELHPSFITITNILRKTWSGEIGLGLMVGPDSRPDMLVTVETVMREAVLRCRRSDVKVGAGVLKRLDHPNIIKVEGFVVSPPMIITEYMQNGCLKDFLMKNSKSSNLTFLRLLEMLRDVASGMNYIAEKGLIHQNLTTESILVSTNWVCKISSFHSVTTVDSTLDLKSGDFTTNIPPSLIRWTAPEVLFNSRTSMGSDVWSFGMVMWQTLSRGEDPYGGWTDEEVVKAVSNSMCLSSPSDDCPYALYQLMMQCWRLHKEARPSFCYIHQVLSSFCDGTPVSAPNFHHSQDRLNVVNTLEMDLNRLNSTQNLTTTRPISPDTNDIAPHTIRPSNVDYPYLTMYCDLLKSKGYNSMEQILMLEDPARLTNIGIFSPTHQFFLLNEIQKLRHNGCQNGTSFEDDSSNYLSSVQQAQMTATQRQHKSRPRSQQITYQHFNNLENVHKFQNASIHSQQQQHQLEQKQPQQQQTSPPPIQGGNPSEFSSRQNLLLTTSQLTLNDNTHPTMFNSSSNVAKFHQTPYNSFSTRICRLPNNGPNSFGDRDKNLPQKYRMGISALTGQKHQGDNFFV